MTRASSGLPIMSLDHHFILVSSAEHSPADYSRSGRYMELRFDRDQVVDALMHIAESCRHAAASDGACFVLHLGI